MEKHCKNCTYCRVLVKFAATSGRDVTEIGDADRAVIADSNVRQIRCAKNVWEHEFSSMAVFNVSSLPRDAAASCPFFDGEEEE